MNVLSLFDGISCARVALERLGYNTAYYASEVDKYAIQIAQKNYPDTIQLGDVRSVKATALPQIDLLIGGSPCQDLSIAKKNREGLSGSRSGLFYEYVRILNEVKPRYFVLENVNSMPKEAKRIITETMGVEPIMIDAALVSAQRRKRLFWTNIPGVTLPEDRGILLKDILESGDVYKNKGISHDKSHCLDANYWKSENLKHHETHHLRQLIIDKPDRIGQIGKGGQGDRVYSVEGKSVNLSANGGGRGAKTGLYLIENAPHGTAFDYYNNTIVPNGKAKVLGTNPQSKTAVAGQLVNDNYIIRKLTPIECERLQSLPDNYTDGISNTQRYKCLGNAFNVEVVRHILSFMDKETLGNVNTESAKIIRKLSPSEVVLDFGNGIKGTICKSDDTAFQDTHFYVHTQGTEDDAGSSSWCLISFEMLTVPMKSIVMDLLAAQAKEKNHV